MFSVILSLLLAFWKKYQVWIILILGGFLILFFVNPFSIFGKSTRLLVRDTPISLKEVHEIGELIASEYHGEVLESLKEIYKGTQETELVEAYRNFKGTYQQVSKEIPARKPRKQLRLFFQKIKDDKKEYFLLKKISNIKKDRQFVELLDTTSWEDFRKKYVAEVEKVVDKYSKKTVKNAELVYLGRGSVKAGFDLSELKEENIQWKGKDTLCLVDFNPKILDVTINPLYIPELGIAGFELIRATGERKITFEEIALVKNACREKLKNEAVERKIFNRAINSAEETLETFFGFLSENKKLKKVMIKPSVFFKVKEEVLRTREIDSANVEDLEALFRSDTTIVKKGVKFLEELKHLVEPQNIAPSFYPLLSQIRTYGKVMGTPDVSPHKPHLNAARKHAFTREEEWDQHHQIKHDSIATFNVNTHKKYKVLGFHPYYMGSAYKSYHFELLWAVSYFSYELNPQTGGYKTIHNWKTTNLIQEAAKHGTKVLLTVSNFGVKENRIFLNSITAQNKLIEELKTLLDLRSAHGVNIDFEEIPRDCRKQFTAFINRLSTGLKKHNKTFLVTLDLYTVDWGKVFEIQSINKAIDLFIIMGYDYYYAGSNNAGPVSPLKSGKEWLPYNLERSVNYYLKEGVAKNQLIVALPYYGRAWKTLGGLNPQKNLKYIQSPAYRDIRKNVSYNNSKFDSISASSYLNLNHNHVDEQIWFDNAKTLKIKYNWIKQQDLAGAGIWALGYDHGYEDLWNVLHQSF